MALEDRCCGFDNNLRENVIRPCPVGRKNWLFSSSVDEANASEVVCAMVEVTKSHVNYTVLLQFAKGGVIYIDCVIIWRLGYI